MSEIINNAVMEAILKRRSTRRYLDTQVSEADINTIIEAGVWAPTANNRQEIEFYVINNRETINIISKKVAVLFNKDVDFSYGAPTFILLYGKTGTRFLEVDSGIAVENMSLAAHSLGLGSVIIGCIKELMNSEDGINLAKSFGIPEDYSFCIAIAIGHIAKPTEPRPRLEGRVHFV